jgi:hypothetical protein
MPSQRSYRGSSSHRSAPYSSSRVYTQSGQSVRNVAAYAATGARTYTASGKSISNPVSYSNAVEGSCRQNSSNPKYLYHYTTDSSASAIKSSGRINASRGPGDCSLGEGVYLTGKAPKCRSDNLLSNNYGGSTSSKSRVESYVRVDADKVGARSGQDQLGRNVWVVDGDLHLKNANAKVGQR